MEIHRLSKGYKAILVVMSYIWAYMYVRVHGQARPLVAIGFIVFAELFFGYCVMTKSVNKFSLSKRIEITFWEISEIVLSFVRQQGTFDNFIAGVFLYIIPVFIVILGMDSFLDRGSLPLSVIDMLKGMVEQPLYNFTSRYKMIASIGKTRVKERETMKNIVLGVIALIIAIPVFIIVVVLLSHADTLFMSFIKRFEFKVDIYTLRKVIEVIYSIPVGMYIFGLFVGEMKFDDEKASKKRSIYDKNIEAVRVFPTVSMNAILSMFVALYIIFFGMFLSHNLSAFWGVVPGDYTAAEYAREGFFEMCWIMFINLVIYGSCSLFSKTKLIDNKVSKVLTMILMSETILFAVSAVSKLALYISRFGVTELRMDATWAICVLVASVALVMVSLFSKKKLLPILFQFSLLSFIIVNIFYLAFN